MDWVKAALDGMRDNLENRHVFLEADREFHVALLTASGNGLFERLSTIIGPVLIMGFRLQAQASPSFEVALEQHTAVYEAVAGGDPETARNTMEKILTTANATVNRIIREREQSGAS